MDDAFDCNNGYRIRRFQDGQEDRNTRILIGDGYDDLVTGEVIWDEEEDENSPAFTVSDPKKPRNDATEKCQVAEAAESLATDRLDQSLSQLATQPVECSVQDEGEGDVTDYSLSLSDEVLVKLFQRLPRVILCQCAQVCRRWRSIALDSCYWQGANLRCFAFEFGMLMSILRRGTVTVCLTNTTLTEQKVSHAGKRHKSRVGKRQHDDTMALEMLPLKYLDATCCKLPSDTLGFLLQCTTQLCKLSLENAMLSTKGLSAIASNPLLEELNLANCQCMTDEVMDEIANSCRRLKCVNVAWSNISPHSLEKFCSCFPCLEEIDVSGLRNTFDDLVMNTLTRNHPNLKKLDASDSSLITGQSLLHIKTFCKELHYLAISRCYNIAPSSIRTLMEMTWLRSLQIFGFSNCNQLTMLKENCSWLKVNDQVFSNIARPIKGNHFNGTIWNKRCT